MHTSTGVRNPKTCPVDCKRSKSKQGHSIGIKGKEENNSAARCCYPFLKYSFQGKGPQELFHPRYYRYSKDYNFINKENYEYLLASAMQYAHLLGEKLHHKEKSDIGLGIVELYDELSELIGDQGLNIEVQDRKLIFVVYQMHCWSDDVLYWLPIKFVEKLETRLKRIVLSFLHELITHNNLATFTDCEYASCFVDMQKERLQTECFTKTEAKEFKSYIKSYEAGKVFNKLKRVKKKSYYKRIPKAINKYVPKNQFEENLIKSLKEGLQFIDKNAPAISNYDYDPDAEMEPDYYPLTTDTTILIIYEFDTMIEGFKEDCDSMKSVAYCLSPTSFLKLSPENQHILIVDDYPERFDCWLEQFSNLISTM